MHYLWPTEELREHWVLTAEELRLLKGLSAPRRLTFCYYLKHFQLHAQFPRVTDLISDDLMNLLTSQIGTDVGQPLALPDRTDRYYRRQVSDYLRLSRFDSKYQRCA